MEDEMLVARAMLECYPYIDDMYDALTRTAERCAMNGFYAIFPVEQMRLYEQIMKCNERKIGLYNMKYLTEAGLGGGGILLRERFFEKKSVSVIAAEHGIPLRTAYRRLEKELCSFTKALNVKGFDKKRLLKEFGNEPLFLSMLNRVIREDDESSRVRKELRKRNAEVFNEVSLRNNRRTHPHRDVSDGVFREGTGASSA